MKHRLHAPWPWLAALVLALALVSAACSGTAATPAPAAPTVAAAVQQAAPTVAAAVQQAAPTVAAAVQSAAPTVAAVAAKATEAPKAAAPAQKVTIRFRAPAWASTQDTRVERQVAFRSVLDAFNQQYAAQGCQVEEIVADDNAVNMTQDIQQKKVDAYWFNFGDYSTRVKAGQLLDLTPYLGNELNNFFPWVQTALKATEGNKVYALWHNTDTPLLFYNTDKIPTAPKTWSELTAMAEKVRKEAPADTYGVSLPFVGWRQMNSGMLAALGGKWVDDKGAPVVFQEPNRALLKALLQNYIDLYQNKLVPASAVGNDNVKQMPDVYAGKVYSFGGNSNFHVRQLKPNLPPDEYKKWAAAPLPYPDKAGKGLYEAGGWMIGAVPSGDKAKDACAAAWVLHATSAQAQATTNKAGVWVPTRPAVIEKDPLFKDDLFYKMTLQALEQGYVLPNSAIWGPLTTSIDTALQRAAKGEASLDDALTQAEAEVMKEYEALKNK